MPKDSLGIDIEFKGAGRIAALSGFGDRLEP